jgi:hypothetical protein
MIPDSIDIGAPWKVLPPGIYDSNLVEIEERYATNGTRRKLFIGLVQACKALKRAGCKTIYLDGGFITDKPYPSDYDVCWNPYHVVDTKLDPVFLDFSNKRSKQKIKYRGEFFLTTGYADGTHLYIEYFQLDKETGLPKGIIRINLD